MSPDEPFWMQSEWWAERGDAAVSRNQLADRWSTKLTSAQRDGTDPTRFAADLCSWAGVLGKAAWMEDIIGETPAMYLRKGVNNVYRDTEAWNSVSTVLGDYGLRLARYTLGFVQIVDERRPDVEDRHDSSVRERARSVASDVRRGLLDPCRPGGNILRTPESLRQFLDNTTEHEALDRVIAMRCYAVRLLKYLVGRDEDEGLIQAVERTVENIADEFGFVVRELEAEVEILNSENEARELVWEAVLRYRDERKVETDWFPTAIKRAVQTANRIITQTPEGQTLPDADDMDAMLALKVRSVETEYYRPRAIKETAASSEALGIVADAEAVRNWNDGQESPVDEQMAFDSVRDRLLAESVDAHAHANRAGGPMWDFWEQRVAIGVLEQPALMNSSRATVGALVRNMWKLDPSRPDTAACTNVKAAAGFVVGLLAVAWVNSIDDRADVSTTLLNSTARVLKLDPTMTKNEVIQSIRGRTAQNVYDQLHGNGASK